METMPLKGMTVMVEKESADTISGIIVGSVIGLAVWIAIVTLIYLL